MIIKKLIRKIKNRKLNLEAKEMELYSTYIETDKFDKVVDFYEKAFQKERNIYTKNRWVEFDFGNKLSIYNKLYDE